MPLRPPLPELLSAALILSAWGPGYITAGGMKRLLQTPSMIVILNEDLTYRQIHTDGRDLEAEPNPSWMGYAVGHWDGDTLVIFEVKTRTARDLFPAELAVNQAKQRQLRRMAAAWVGQLPKRLRGRVMVRFDVLSVYLVTDEAEFEHIKAAFPFRESS